MDIKENAKDVDVWVRGLFILLFGFVYYFLFFILLIIVIFQFVMKVITTEVNNQLLEFSDDLTRYISQILNYITFRSEERPWPFSSWPTAKTTSNDVSVKKISKKKTAKKKTSSQKKEDDPDKPA